MEHILDLIDEIVSDDYSGELIYHYTSSEGLLGIIQNKTLRCSQSYFLNDFEENLNGWKLFLRTLENYSREGEEFEIYRKIVKSTFKHWINLNLEDLSYEIFKKIEISAYRSFIFSASYKKDDLNQWRSYSPESNGYSIGFKIDNSFKRRQLLFRDNDIEDKLNINNCKILIKNCIYNDHLKQKMCERLLDYHYEKYIESDPDWTNNIFFNVLTLSLYFKNHKFEEEKECRIIVLPIGDTLVDLFRKDINILKFRSGKNLIVPYVELDLFSDCIQNIIISATPNKYHSKEAVEILLKAYFPDQRILVETSEIPYRI